MFAITGTPGVGKSATAALLVGRLDRCVVAEMDLFTQPELDSDSQRMMAFFRSWLKLGAAVAQSGNHLVTAGFVRPQELESPPERALFSAIHYLVLTCGSQQLTERIRRRQRDGTLPAGDLEGLHALNQWFETTTQEGVTVLDTSELTAEDAAHFATRWIRDALGAS